MNDLFHHFVGEDAFSRKKELRPHQIRALEQIRQSVHAGNTRVVLQAATGFGKTLVAAKIIEGALAKGNRVIFTAPTVSLIDQTVRSFEAEGIRDIGVMQANHPRTDSLSQVQVASVQTLARREIPHAAVIIVDEAHVRAKVIEQLMDQRLDVIFIGLSATPWAKGMGLRWQDLVTPVTIGDLIDQGFLSSFTAYAPDVPDLSGVKVKDGDYDESGLEAVMGDAKLMGSVVNTWLERGKDQPTLCFCVNRAHAAELAAQFERHGIATACVDARTDRVERQIINQRFSSGEVRIICSVRTMTTGVDLPVSCIIDAAPTKSEMLHVQKIGRGLRVNPGTEDCIVLDHAGNSLRLGLVTDIHHPTLDKTRNGETQPSKKGAEKLPKACVKCETLHAGRICSACGHERKPVANIEAADGDLVEIAGRKAKVTKAEKQLFWSMARWVDRERSKGGRLAKALYKGKFGVWPRGLEDTPMAPDQAFLNYEHSRRIAYAKRTAKERSAA